MKKKKSDLWDVVLVRGQHMRIVAKDVKESTMEKWIKKKQRGGKYVGAPKGSY